MEVNDEMVEIEAFKTTLLFIYNTYKTKNVELTGDSALAVLYIGIDRLEQARTEGVALYA